MFTKKRIIIIIGLVVLLVLVCTVSVRCTYFSGDVGECLSIAFFEKQKLSGIDRVVIEDFTGKKVETTNKDFISRLCDKTTVATRSSAPHGGYDKWIYMYRGEELVRTMKWADCCNHLEIYEGDALHWLFTPAGGSSEVGYVQLPKDLIADMNALFETP
ncbi:MAG: hypothetical protein IJB11_06750 [Oscillospiraceae bacterium]|nr:hypothetical protein [Oscillospiraceae bacterium]